MTDLVHITAQDTILRDLPVDYTLTIRPPAAA
jgi:hypothetical protein